jgi:CRISPR/Cas system CSM-associated protein Csm3 (group 7 of RAMP superfamily)
VIEFAYQLSFHTVSHIGTGRGFAGFLDGIVMRDHDDNVYVPGSSIKGKTRAAARRLAHSLGIHRCPPEHPCGPAGAVCTICAIFGSPQIAGRFYFENVQLPTLYQDLLADVRKYDPIRARNLTTDRRTQVMLSRRRRSAHPDHLFTFELMQPDLPLSGRIEGHLSSLADDQMLPREALLLWGALESITHMGKSRARGWGRCSLHAELFWQGQPVDRRQYAEALRQLGGGEAT